MLLHPFSLLTRCSRVAFLILWLTLEPTCKSHMDDVIVMAYVMYDGCTLRVISTRPQPSYGTMAERKTSLCANRRPPGGADLQSVAPGEFMDHEPLGFLRRPATSYHSHLKMTWLLQGTADSRPCFVNDVASAVRTEPRNG